MNPVMVQVIPVITHPKEFLKPPVDVALTPVAKAGDFAIMELV